MAFQQVGPHGAAPPQLLQWLPCDSKSARPRYARRHQLSVCQSALALGGLQFRKPRQLTRHKGGAERQVSSSAALLPAPGEDLAKASTSPAGDDVTCYGSSAPHRADERTAKHAQARVAHRVFPLRKLPLSTEKNQHSLHGCFQALRQLIWELILARGPSHSHKLNQSIKLAGLGHLQAAAIPCPLGPRACCQHGARRMRCSVGSCGGHVLRCSLAKHASCAQEQQVRPSCRAAAYFATASVQRLADQHAAVQLVVVAVRPGCCCLSGRLFSRFQSFRRLATSKCLATRHMQLPGEPHAGTGRDCMS